MAHLSKAVRFGHRSCCGQYDLQLPGQIVTASRGEQLNRAAGSEVATRDGAVKESLWICAKNKEAVCLEREITLKHQRRCT